MRTSLLVALALLAATAAPTALAASASVALTPPEGAVQPDAAVPIDVALVLHDFMCHEPYQVSVILMSSASEGVQANWQEEAVYFTIPAQAYFSDVYRANATAFLAVTGTQAGQAEITAHFAAADGPCFVPGGFDQATTTVTLRVDAPSAEPAPEPSMGPEPSRDEAPVAAPANDTAAANATAPANETGATNATNESAMTPATPARTTGPACPPEGNCGRIGEYQAPAESSDSAQTPGVGFLLGAGVLAVAALVARRRNNT